MDTITGTLKTLKKLDKRLDDQEVQSTPRDIYLKVPLTSVDWDGDGKSTAAAAILDLSVVFGAPAGIKAIIAHLECNDSAAWGSDVYTLNLGPSDTYYYELQCCCYGGDLRNSVNGPVTCDANGDVYVRTTASGANTLDCKIQIYGYVI